MKMMDISEMMFRDDGRWVTIVMVVIHFFKIIIIFLKKVEKKLDKKENMSYLCSVKQLKNKTL